MTPRPDLNALSKQIVEANKAKDFHDVKHSNEHSLCLVISELMEAVEADRKGRFHYPKIYHNVKEYPLKEEWRDILNYEDTYQVSNFGRVKSKDMDVWNMRRNYESKHFSFLFCAVEKNKIE